MCVFVSVPQAVARLTADNLVFLAQLRAAESAAAAATAERDELLLALEEHKGPWMDEVSLLYDIVCIKYLVIIVCNMCLTFMIYYNIITTDVTHTMYVYFMFCV